MSDNKKSRLIAKIFYIVLGILCVWLLVRFALPWVLPFLLALLTAKLIEPAVLLLNRRFRFRRGFCSAVCTTAALGLAVGAAAFLTGRLVFELGRFIERLPEYTQRISDMLGSLDGSIDGFIASMPENVRSVARSMFDRLAESGAEIPVALSGRLMGLLTALAGGAPRVLLFAATYAIAVYFTSSQYPAVTQFVMRQIPGRFHGKIRDAKDDLFNALGKWLKAEAMLMLVTFCELAVGLALLRVDYAFMLALVIAAIDALPVFGTGTVLLPWAVFSILMGQIRLGIGLALLYAAVTFVRSLLEPKIIGSQLGVHPLATLAAIYVGFCVLGVAGMILFPIALVLLKQFNDRGCIALWR